MRAARASGKWLGLPPFGYKKEIDENNKPIIVQSEKASIVKNIFSSIAKGKTQSEIREKLKKDGIIIPESSFGCIIRNRVYIGEILVKSENGNFYVKGLHAPLIDERTFNKVQATFNNSKELIKAKCFSEDFPLRSIIKCDNCGNKLTGSFSKSRNGNKHKYYHCNNCGQVRLRVDDTNKKVEAILSEITISKPAQKLYDLMVKNLFQKIKINKRPLNTIKNEIMRIENRIKNIQDSFADRQIDLDSYTQSKRRYANEFHALRKESEEFSNDNLNTKSF